MNSHPYLAVVLVLSSVAALFAALRLLQRRCSPSPELSRKLMHVGTGLIALTLPWLFSDAAPVLIACALAFAGLLAIRYLPACKSLRCVIDGVERRSVGELCIPVAVAVLFVISSDDILIYSIPLLAMTFADTAAAMVGRRFGTVRSSTGKTLEGSFTFFVVTLLATDIPLRIFVPLAALDAFLIAMLLAVLLTAIEAASVVGLDNFFVPVGGLFLLHIFFRMDLNQLAFQLGLNLMLLALAFFHRTRPGFSRLTH